MNRPRPNLSEQDLRLIFELTALVSVQLTSRIMYIFYRNLGVNVERREVEQALKETGQRIARMTALRLSSGNTRLPVVGEDELFLFVNAALSLVVQGGGPAASPQELKAYNRLTEERTADLSAQMRGEYPGDSEHDAYWRQAESVYDALAFAGIPLERAASYPGIADLVLRAIWTPEQYAQRVHRTLNTELLEGPLAKKLHEFMRLELQLRLGRKPLPVEEYELSVSMKARIRKAARAVEQEKARLIRETTPRVWPPRDAGKLRPRPSEITEAGTKGGGGRPAGSAKRKFRRK